MSRAVTTPAEEVIVITGASGGIGRAAARAFARPGARIALLARGERGLAGARSEVEARGAQALAIPVDVADWRAVSAAADAIHRQWGRIDVWVNNAMLTVFGPIDRLSPDDLQRVTEVTYLGAAYATMAALKFMRARDRGVIVQVGSALAYRAIPLQAAYCASKHALRGFTDSLRCELLHDGSQVHVTMVHLSAFNTPQFDWAKNLMGRRAQPVPPIFQPELAARAIVWAARHRRREVFVGWPAVQAVVANKIAPGLLDRYLAKSGYSGQLTDQTLPSDACTNLRHACDTNPGAHGRFDRRSRKVSLQWIATSHRRAAMAAVVAMAALAALYVTRRSHVAPASERRR
jgi:NAD(P)-dependent dehydrogenase (short-subunit alcohol dehydrogenase family)